VVSSERITSRTTNNLVRGLKGGSLDDGCPSTVSS
jgi:hypothetical protein